MMLIVSIAVMLGAAVFWPLLSMIPCIFLIFYMTIVADMSRSLVFVVITGFVCDILWGLGFGSITASLMISVGLVAVLRSRLDLDIYTPIGTVLIGSFGGWLFVSLSALFNNVPVVSNSTIYMAAVVMAMNLLFWIIVRFRVQSIPQSRWRGLE